MRTSDRNELLPFGLMVLDGLERRGWSANELAKRIQYDQSMFNKVINAHKNARYKTPPIEMVYHICHALQLDLSPALVASNQGILDILEFLGKEDKITLRFCTYLGAQIDGV